MATLKEWMQKNNVAEARISAAGNAINFIAENKTQVGTLMTREETPALEDLLDYLKERKDYTCTVSGNFVTLSAPAPAVKVTSLWDEDEAPAKSKRKVKA